MMQWQKLLTTKRFGMEQYHNDKHDGRTEFQRDYDRLIFSAPFRRLQNKTQVFPLPGSVFVHNRLTHSLEVSCVGRSIGHLVSESLSKKYNYSIPLLSEIGSIVAAACLAHDLGNPPFGHSGEKAIATYFSEGNGVQFKSQLSEVQWMDFAKFEGNANAFRLLTNQFQGRRKGGFVLTYSTLASIVKYPYESIFADTNKNKFGFFQTEKESYTRIANELGIIQQPDNKQRFARHPLVYLVEAADDICYLVMDIEDAFKLKIISFDEICSLLFAFLPAEKQKRAKEILNMVNDTNEQIAYIRSSVMGILIEACAKIFIENETNILNGNMKKSLIAQLPEPLNTAYKKAAELSIATIYRSREVLDIELAGQRIISELTNNHIEAVLHPDKSYSKQLLNRIPSQYDIFSKSIYCKIQSILDYISGMTDVYALDLYRKINGMSLPTL